MSKKVVVFDLDGTLIDSKKIYIDTIQRSLLEHNFIYPKSHISKALGPKIEITLRNIDKFSPKTLKILKDNINRNVTKKAGMIKLAPCAKKTLKKLSKKYRLILLTNSAKQFVNAVLKKNRISKYFSRIYYSENFSNKENAIRSIANRYKTKVKDILYIADKITDVKIARKTGCKIIIILAVSWDKNKLKHKRYVIRTLKELKI